MNKSIAFFAVMLLLSGCQSTAPAEQTETAQPSERQYASFSEETLYSLLSAEIAAQRNRFDITLVQYVDQAIKTRDPAVAERAYRIAEFLDATPEALEVALIWANAAPNDVDAHRAAAIQLARVGRYDESMRYMETVLQQSGETHFDFLALAAAESDPVTRQGMHQSFDRLLQKYPDNPQLLFGKSLLLQQDGHSDQALQLLESNTTSQYEVAPLLLRARLLQNQNRGGEALSLLKRGLREHPQDKRLRLAHARLLVELEQLGKAKQAFTQLLNDYPDDDDLRFSLALICLERQDWDEAEIYLQELIDRDSPHMNAARFSLGRLSEERQDMSKALQEYALVGLGNDYLPAQMRQTEILIGQHRTQEAIQRLSDNRASQPELAVQLYLVQAEALSNNDQPELAWQTIRQALEDYPDDSSLLYTRSMLAEKRGDLSQLEKDLRTIIAREPDNAMALNALGYTLADRTNRYQEALALIEKAHQLNPEDPATLDSMGWVHYRLGDLDQAEKYLRQAYDVYPDHEVAAHLGEVLWMQGKRREARKIWSDALKSTPDSKTLSETLQRLTGKGTPS